MWSCWKACCGCGCNLSTLLEAMKKWRTEIYSLTFSVRGLLITSNLYLSLNLLDCSVLVFLLVFETLLFALCTFVCLIDNTSTFMYNIFLSTRLWCKTLWNPIVDSCTGTFVGTCLSFFAKDDSHLQYVSCSYHKPGMYHLFGPKPQICSLHVSTWALCSCLK